MDETLNEDQPCLFTVGHSNHEMDAFLKLLGVCRIQVLADVRSYPYSRYVPHFNCDQIGTILKRARIKYLFLGKELGGRPEGKEFYDEEGHVLYYRVADSAPFLEGVTRLEQGIRRFRVAVMCSEENPAMCHRYLLVSRVMADRGTRIRHIRGDGSIQPHLDLAAATRQQQSLFYSSEDSTWKSLRSVLPRNLPRGSSDSSSITESSD